MIIKCNLKLEKSELLLRRSFINIVWVLTMVGLTLIDKFGKSSYRLKTWMNVQIT